MNKTLAIVLPVRNAESTLRKHVTDVLEIAGELTDGLRLFIVDNGSTDDTFDTAFELSTRFPQVRVLRNSDQQGLGATLDALRMQVSGDFVLVHDGASPIDANQIRELWIEEQTRHQAGDDRTATIDDLRRASAGHAAMAAAHARLAGFQRMSTTPAKGEDLQLSRRDTNPQAGVGVIPPLPRPNFIGALANFALGE